MTATRPEAVVHGSVSAAELAQYGLQPDDVLDFSVNTNPLGPAPNVLAAIRDTDWTRYPGDDERPLRAGLAEQCGVTVEHVALGNGSSELLWLLALATLRPDDSAAVLGPTFGEYARAISIMRAHVTDRADHTSRMVFVCNPNNPTGEYLSLDALRSLADAHPSALVVVDEAYASFVEHRWRSEPLLDLHPNLVIVRSLTKDHALPGLRLGYLLASPAIASAVEAVRPPWSVNAGALRAGLATLAPDAMAHVTRARAVVAESRALLRAGLARLGYAVNDSHANFVLAEVGSAAEFRRALLPDAIVVRDCTSFNLPTHVRIACRLPADCAHLIDVVSRMAH